MNDEIAHLKAELFRLKMDNKFLRLENEHLLTMVNSFIQVVTDGPDDETFCSEPTAIYDTMIHDRSREITR